MVNCQQELTNVAKIRMFRWACGYTRNIGLVTNVLGESRSSTYWGDNQGLLKGVWLCEKKIKSIEWKVNQMENSPIKRCGESLKQISRDIIIKYCTLNDFNENLICGVL